MSDEKRFQDKNENPAAGGELFSVDADAHLQKLAACMFPTPAQLPVELVRAALKRRARAVAVEVRSARLVIEDDGEEIAACQWQQLACALDTRHAGADREKAIRSLQDAAHPGIGLLAVLVPGAEEIRIESPGKGNRPALLVRGATVRFVASTAVSNGTRITIRRCGGAVRNETKLLMELCAAVAGKITINGLQIGKKPVLRRTLVQQGVDLDRGAGPFLVAIPAQGDICRIWLLDQQIPWQLFTCAAYRGLVFDAALESRQAATELEFAQLATAAAGLYHWLGDHYSSFPPRYQERIEELLFKRMATTGDLKVLSAFAPFRLRRSQQRLSLEEVRRKANEGRLLALPLASSSRRFPDIHQEALQLSPRQRDFLLYVAGVPLIALSSSAAGSGLHAKLAGAWTGFARRLAIRLPRRRVKTHDAASLSADEARLCHELELMAHGQTRSVSPFPLHVAMIPGRGRSPCLWRPAMTGDLLLRRDHPLVKAAVRSVARDRANAELALAALVPLRIFDSRPPLT